MENISSSIHTSLIFPRRIERLTELFCDKIPDGSSVLDVGTGNGQLAKNIGDRKKDVKVQGVDVLLRDYSHIPVTLFDGSKLPFDDKSFDIVTFVDVLHHTNNAKELLAEALRVSRKLVIIKDHLVSGFLAGPTLRLMDEVGNRRYNVALPYNYFTPEQWRKTFSDIGAKIQFWEQDLKIYQKYLDMIFGRNLHVLTGISSATAMQ